MRMDRPVVRLAVVTMLVAAVGARGEAPSFEPAHLELAGTVRLAAPPSAVFDLLTPAGLERGTPSWRF